MSKFSLTSTISHNFTIIDFLQLKWHFFQCNAKYLKKAFWLLDSQSLWQILYEKGVIF